MDVPLRTAGKTVEKRIDIAPTTLDDIEIAEPVRGLVQATNARQSIVIGGEATTSVILQCARCLRDFVQPLELELEASAPLHFFAAHSNDEAKEDGEADDEIVALFDATSVDVLELIRQAIVLQSPLQPLCSPDCPGLPEAANYKERFRDRRWSALEQWKE